MAPASNARGQAGGQDAAVVPVNSMVCVRALPMSGDELGGHPDPAEDGWLYFAIGAQHNRVSIIPGMHVDREHAVVAAYPGHFNPSGEVVDTRVIRQMGAAYRGELALAQASVTPIPAIWQTPGCARCGWVAEGLGVMVPATIDARRYEQARLSPYTDEHDPADVAESAYMAAWAQASVQAKRSLREQARAAASLHGSCPADIEPLDPSAVLTEYQIVSRRQELAPGRR